MGRSDRRRSGPGWPWTCQIPSAGLGPGGAVAGGGGDGYGRSGAGQALMQVAFAGGRVQPEQHRPGRPAAAPEFAIAVELVDEDGEGFGAGVVFEVKRHRLIAL